MLHRLVLVFGSRMNELKSLKIWGESTNVTSQACNYLRCRSDWYPQESNTGGTSTLGYDYPQGVLLQYRCTSTPRYFYPSVRLPPIHRGVLLHYRCTITPRYFYPARVRLPPIHRGVLLPCQGTITPRYFYPARVRLPPIHRGVLSPCQGRNYPPVKMVTGVFRHC